jgi:hypothetical protein
MPVIPELEKFMQEDGGVQFEASLAFICDLVLKIQKKKNKECK